MKPSHRKAIAVGALTAMVSGAGLTYAHLENDETDERAKRRHHCVGGHHRWGKRWFGSQHIAGKLAFIKTELKITPDQEPAWNAFADSMREFAQRQSEVRERRRMDTDRQSLNLMERIDRKLQFMETNMGHLQQLAEAFRGLYGQLTPEQQEIAESIRDLRRL